MHVRSITSISFLSGPGRTRNGMQLLAALSVLAFSTACGQNLVIGEPVGGKIQQTSAYFADSIHTVRTGLASVSAIAVDDQVPGQTRVFWTDFAGQKINVLSVEANSVATVATSASAGLQIPRGLAVDPVVRRVYWTDNGSRKLQKCWYDGSHVTDLVSSLGSPGCVALDRVNEKLYFTDNGTGVKSIYRCDTSGASLQQIVGGLSQVKGIALDIAHGFIYWVDAGTLKLQRASLTGTFPATIQDVAALSSAPRALLIDDVAHTIFWTTIGTPSIYRMMLDTPVPGVLISTGLTAPSSLALTTSAALPIMLSSFTASLTGTTVQLHWRTESEINNYGFVIERLRGTAWDSLSFLPGAGTSAASHEYRFTDQQLPQGERHIYRLKQIDLGGSVHYSESIEATAATSDLAAGSTSPVPTAFELGQNYPNPFNPATTIRIGVPEQSRVAIQVYDIRGSLVATWLDADLPAGYYTLNFNGAGLSSGIYFYRMTTQRAGGAGTPATTSLVKRFTLLK